MSPDVLVLLLAGMKRIRTPNGTVAHLQHPVPGSIPGETISTLCGARWRDETLRPATPEQPICHTCQHFAELAPERYLQLVGKYR